MQCYTELTPPTAVTHSITLQLVPGQGTNLAVAKASLLQIFKTKVVSAELDAPATLNGANTTKTATAGRYDSRLVNDDDGFEASFLGGDNIAARADRANSAKLVLVAEVTLPGTITGLARIKKPSGSSAGGTDCLLLSFRDARLSLVEWNVERNTLETVSIHYYEQEELVGSPWVAPLHHYPTLLIADPASRCAALKFSERNLAILPFKQPDEDMDMDNWDEELDGPRPKKDLAGATANGASTIEDTPYSPSFVLRLSKLEASLLHPVHLAFLHEYRDPTIGVLSSTKTASNSLGHKDHFTYMVFTLDLQQRASTTILAVNGLPQDLFRVVALPAPVGGALLVGANELIHIDQSGKSNGIAVNPLTKQTTSFSLVDQSDLELRLEGCAIDVLAAELGEFLLVLNDGRMGLLTFRIDGRTVSGLSIKMLGPEAGGNVIQSRVTSLSRIGRSTVFVGSEEGDSILLGWSRKQGQTQKKKSRIQDADLDLDLDEEDLEDDDDDDLYGEESTSPEQAISVAKAVKSGDLNFRIHDRLLSIAPIQKMTYGQSVTLPDSEEERNSQGVRSDLQIVSAVGRGKASALAIMNLAIQPKIIGRFEFPEARGFWTVCAKKPIPKTLVGDKGPMNNDYDTSGQHHKFMIVAKVDLDGYETSDVYALTAAGFESLTGTEFEPAAGFTVEAGTMGKDSRILQVLKSEVRCYDGDLGLSQIVPMQDEETGAEPRVRTASIADPFLLLLRDDFSVFIAEMSPKLLELEEMEKEDQILTNTKWLTGCLYTDTNSVFADEATGKTTKDNILMFLLSTSGVLYIYRLPDLTKPVYVAEGLSYIPPGLSADYSARKGTAKESVAEILVADLGDTTHKSPYLILRHANDDLTLYQPYRLKATPGEPFSKSLFFQKVPNSTFAKAPEEKPVDDDEPHNAQRFLPMRRCSNISGYSTVFLPGSSPSFVLKTSKSSPRVLGLQGSGVQAMSSFHTEGCEHGFIYADTNGIARVTQIPTDSSYAELGISVKKIPVGVDTQSVAFHPPTQAYVVGCNDLEPFELPKDDDYHKEWARENLTFKPMVDRGMLKLLSGITWTVIDTVDLEPCETVLCVETLNLEVSESTNERKQLIAVGTALTKGEDLPTRGRVYVFDIADVIPEPGKPETSKKLKLVAKEDIPRGAVTALSEVGTQGLMLVAQGQKCMVRGLKEDGTLLPVAFMDMNCYVTSVKELPGTGLCLMADAFKGVWFTGYTEEPYKMMLFGKSSTRMEVLNADFLPDGKELYIVASDADGHLHILQFDPEHPKSLQGHLLLHRTSFNTGAHHPTTSLLLPAAYPTSSPSSLSFTDENPPHILLLASPTGLLATLRPLPENAYRRLSSLAVQLTNALPHPAGLNPKGYRLPSPSASASMQLPGVDAGIGRNIVDGKVLERFMELGTGKRQEIAGRAGYMVSATNGGVNNPGGSGKMMGTMNGSLTLMGLKGQEAGGMEWEEVRGELGGVLGWSGLGYF